MKSSDITLQIYHHHLKIPIESYFNTVTDFLDPWDERAYQFVVHQYLEKGKDNGIVGMVRQERDEKYVYLDAAVRYPQAMDGQVSLESTDGGKDM
ncbi:hypothetical protein [Desulfosporosinus lacus]|uniref:Uncharacterized protein n=1 Tax=Desulfosporosinus lacus DSM 15449 TaxID=1121420 RepID=A0A1M5XPI4_9FIRM|nr:hypothetical protein [Desulfosporosinus lacus]SHI01448.1 hypothetical protein SAMN02746098_02138 [Desulfosporosinus lacus DSM 15449]